ncbi:MAG: hypothetical protein ACR2I7_02710 [Geodermatophilaceae bacterium]
MSFGVVLIAVGGFLLGGAYSVATLESGGARNRRAQLALASVLVLLALYLVIAGVLEAMGE